MDSIEKRKILENGINISRVVYPTNIVGNYIVEDVPEEIFGERINLEGAEYCAGFRNIQVFGHPDEVNSIYIFGQADVEERDLAKEEGKQEKILNLRSPGCLISEDSDEFGANYFLENPEYGDSTRGFLRGIGGEVLRGGGRVLPVSFLEKIFDEPMKKVRQLYEGIREVLGWVIGNKG